MAGETSLLALKINGANLLRWNRETRRYNSTPTALASLSLPLPLEIKATSRAYGERLPAVAAKACTTAMKQACVVIPVEQDNRNGLQERR